MSNELAFTYFFYFDNIIIDNALSTLVEFQLSAPELITMKTKIDSIYRTVSVKID